MEGLGGRFGILLILITLGASVGIFLGRHRFSELGHLGYVGVALIAFLGNAPVIPVFPWLVVVGAMVGAYPMVGLLIAGAIGAALGESVPYLWGSHLSKTHSDHKWIAKLASLPAWGRYLAVFLMSLSPAFSFPGFASGMLRVPFWAMTLMKISTEALKLWLVLEAVQKIFVRS